MGVLIFRALQADRVRNSAMSSMLLVLQPTPSQRSSRLMLSSRTSHHYLPSDLLLRSEQATQSSHKRRAFCAMSPIRCLGRRTVPVVLQPYTTLISLNIRQVRLAQPPPSRFEIDEPPQRAACQYYSRHLELAVICTWAPSHLGPPKSTSSRPRLEDTIAQRVRIQASRHHLRPRPEAWYRAPRSAEFQRTCPPGAPVSPFQQSPVAPSGRVRFPMSNIFWRLEIDDDSYRFASALALCELCLSEVLHLAAPPSFRWQMSPVRMKKALSDKICFVTGPKQSQTPRSTYLFFFT